MEADQRRISHRRSMEHRLGHSNKGLTAMNKNTVKGIKWSNRTEEFLGRYTTYSESEAYRITHARTLAGNAPEFHLTLKDRSKTLFVSQFHSSLKAAKENAELDALMQVNRKMIDAAKD
jgi:hypothetical protein